MIKPPFGLHIRLNTTMHAVAARAHALEVPFFQTFAIFPTGTYIQLTEDDERAFVQLRHHFGPLFLHASYWINGASTSTKTTNLLRHELHLAQRLQFDHVILHPGAATATQNKQHALERIARRINLANTLYPEITIVLENIAHAARSIGGALEDLRAIAERCDRPEKLGFCIDTAHAHAHGYDITTARAQDEFIAELDRVLGLNNVRLIHLNDTNRALGSHIDQHTAPGQGQIGTRALKRLANHPQLHAVPMLLELPLLDAEQETAILKEVSTWRQRHT